jgi:hypothetical protein
MIGSNVQNLLIILGSIVNIVGEGGGRHIWSLCKKENFHFVNELDIHKMSRSHWETGCGHKLNWLILSHELDVSEKWMQS